MKDVEIADHFIKLIQTKNFNEPEVLEAYKALKKIAHLTVEESQMLVSNGFIQFFDKSLPDKNFYLGHYNAVSINDYDLPEEEKRCEDFKKFPGIQFCAKSSMDEIKRLFKEQYQIAIQEDTSKVFFMNNNREVIEWALEHKSELGLDKLDVEFVRKYQDNVILRNLIFKSYGLKEEKIKSIDEMSFKEIIEEFSTLLHNFHACEENGNFEKLYDKIAEKAEIEVEWKYFTAEVTIFTKRSHYTIITNSVSGRIFWLWMNHKKNIPAGLEFVVLYAQRDAIRVRCFLANLEQIKEELTDDVLEKVFKGRYLAPFGCLLVNPRREVVEWALEHKEGLNLDSTEREFAEYNQINPELRELILKELE